MQRRGGRTLTAVFGVAGFHGGAERDVGQLRAQEGNVHGGVSILVLHVDVGTLRHQQLHQVGVPLRHCQLQRRLVAVVPDVDVAASLGEYGWHVLPDR